jgi:hypothetical protein
MRGWSRVTYLSPFGRAPPAAAGSPVCPALLSPPAISLSPKLTICASCDPLSSTRMLVPALDEGSVVSMVIPMLLTLPLGHRSPLRPIGQRCGLAVERGYPRTIQADFTAALGASLVFLVLALILVGDSKPAEEPPPVYQLWKSRALKKLRATAIELPTPPEAKVAENIQTMRWEGRRLRSHLDNVHAQYQDLTRKLEERLLDQEAKLDQAYSALRQERSERHALKRDLAKLIDRHLAIPTGNPTRLSVARDEHVAETTESSMDQAALLHLRTAVQQIVPSLKEARHQALASGDEQIVTIDVQDRSFQVGAGAKKFHIPKDIVMRLHTAKSQLIREYIGR